MSLKIGVGGRDENDGIDDDDIRHVDNDNECYNVDYCC